MASDRVLVNFFYAHNVGHAVEAPHYCPGHDRADPDREVAVALNAATAVELADDCPLSHRRSRSIIRCGIRARIRRLDRSGCRAGGILTSERDGPSDSGSSKQPPMRFPSTPPSPVGGADSRPQLPDAACSRGDARSTWRSRPRQTCTASLFSPPTPATWQSSPTWSRSTHPARSPKSAASLEGDKALRVRIWRRAMGAVGSIGTNCMICMHSVPVSAGDEDGSGGLRGDRPVATDGAARTAALIAQTL
jgi:hypothetical protein